MKRSTVTCVAYLLAVPGFVACFLRHLCMCGHLAHVEGPQWVWEFASDAPWFFSLITTAVFGLVSGVRQPRWLGVIAVVLLGSRCLLASGGGYCGIFPELPLLLLGCWLAVRHLMVSGRANLPAPDAPPGT
ncbi:MAG: hypothetical protein ACRCZF_01055 [Gemmataceae bacterium]